MNHRLVDSHMWPVLMRHSVPAYPPSLGLMLHFCVVCFEKSTKTLLHHFETRIESFSKQSPLIET
jgi:hypothetical protein